MMHGKSVFLRCLIVLIGASAATGARGQDAIALFEQAQQRWRAAAIDDYRFAYKKHCPCYRDEPATTIVSVRAGQVAEVRYRHDGAADDIVVAADRIQWYWTVDDLFSVIAAALESGMAGFTAEYDPLHGYPQHLYLDYDPATAGDEIELRAVELVRLPQD